MNSPHWLQLVKWWYISKHFHKFCFWDRILRFATDFNILSFIFMNIGNYFSENFQPLFTVPFTLKYSDALWDQIWINQLVCGGWSEDAVQQVWCLLVHQDRWPTKPVEGCWHRTGPVWKCGLFPCMGRWMSSSSEEEDTEGVSFRFCLFFSYLVWHNIYDFFHHVCRHSWSL